MSRKKEFASNGLSKRWTPAAEEKYHRLLAACRTFGERHLVMTIVERVKYDGRTKQGKRAMLGARLRLANATDEELKDLAELEAEMPTDDEAGPEEILQHYKTVRAQIREEDVNGIHESREGRRKRRLTARAELGMARRKGG